MVLVLALPSSTVLFRDISITTVFSYQDSVNRLPTLQEKAVRRKPLVLQIY